MSNAYLDSQERNTMRILAANKWTRVFTEGGTKYRLDVTAELVHREGNAKPYFSITGNMDRQSKNGRWMFDSCGVIHEAILEKFPHLQPLVNVHLSDDNGVPMHAYANAAYHAGSTAVSLTYNLPNLAKHLRVVSREAQAMKYAALARNEPTDQAWEAVCAEWNMPALWAADAAKALALLNINKGDN